MKVDNRFEDIDKSALYNALLNLHVCPNCRKELNPLALLENTWGCSKCKETWHIEGREGK